MNRNRLTHVERHTLLFLANDSGLAVLAESIPLTGKTLAFQRIAALRRLQSLDLVASDDAPVEADRHWCITHRGIVRALAIIDSNGVADVPAVADWVST